MNGETRSGDQEVNAAEPAEEQTPDPERDQRSRLEVAHQKAHGEVGRRRGPTFSTPSGRWRLPLALLALAGDGLCGWIRASREKEARCSPHDEWGEEAEARRQRRHHLLDPVAASLEQVADRVLRELVGVDVRLVRRQPKPSQRPVRCAAARSRGQVKKQDSVRRKLRPEPSEQQPGRIEVLEDVGDPDVVEGRLGHLGETGIDIGLQRLQTQPAAEVDVLAELVDSERAGTKVHETMAERATHVEDTRALERPVLERQLESARKPLEASPEHLLGPGLSERAPLANLGTQIIERPQASTPLALSRRMKTRRTPPGDTRSERAAGSCTPMPSPGVVMARWPLSTFVAVHLSALPARDDPPGHCILGGHTDLGCARGYRAP